jgi:hypothetical protein
MTEPELDIVEELRFFAEASDADGIAVAMLSGRIFADAADEIDRLRSLVAAWADAQDAQRETKPTSLRWWTDKFDAELALRKAIGRAPKKRTIMPKRAKT